MCTKVKENYAKTKFKYQHTHRSYKRNQTNSRADKDN